MEFKKLIEIILKSFGKLFTIGCMRSIFSFIFSLNVLIFIFFLQQLVLYEIYIFLYILFECINLYILFHKKVLKNKERK